ncbi:MAG: hypothetical protein QNJ72_30050 [Pleurocapsa sp. MO_226.B13]|nr:hypothetical protein [Pleurocapsa sp. MO_226.B13]
MTNDKAVRPRVVRRRKGMRTKTEQNTNQQSIVLSSKVERHD